MPLAIAAWREPSSCWDAKEARVSFHNTRSNHFCPSVLRAAFAQAIARPLVDCLLAKARTRLAIAPQVFAIFSQQTKREENLYEGIERSGHLRSSLAGSPPPPLSNRRQQQLEFNQNFLINKSLPVIRPSAA
jgi:hypothetical protein